MENQREKLRRLGYSPPEIESIISADRAIDRGEKLFELTPQQKKVEKEMRQVARAPTVYKFENRARKADEMKKCILSQLVKALEPNCDAPPRNCKFRTRIYILLQWEKIQGCTVMPPHLTGAFSRFRETRAGRPQFLNDFLKFPLDILMYLYYNKDNKRIKKGNDDK